MVALWVYRKDEKGIRSKSGTVPAAVGPDSKRLLHNVIETSVLRRRNREGQVRRPAIGT